ncbi:ArnT family glycosyltransferase [Candidatus Aenigmatarchaeota archaeon]
MFKNKTIFILFLIVLFCGIFIRSYDLGWEPLGFGEVEVYQSAEEFLKGNFTKNFYIFAETPLMKYIFTLFMFLFSPPVEIALRLVSVLFGALSIILVFFFTKKIYNDEWLALIASTITAFSIIHIELSRYIQIETALSFFYLAVFYIFWNFIHNRNNKNAVLLGIIVGLGVLIKTAFINAIITVLIIALLYKIISFKIKPNFSISIDNKLIKAAILAVIVFFIVWPLSLFPLSMNAIINIEGTTNEINADVPTFLLVFGYRLTNVGGAVTDNFFLNIPIIGHFFFFLVKESFFFIALFFIGIYSIIKRFVRGSDSYIITIISIFFILMWLQHFRYTYRYIAIIIPFLSIIAARSIHGIKPFITNKIKSIEKHFNILFLIIIILVMLITSIIASPNYALYYNEARGLFDIPDSEGVFGEGMKNVIENIENCNSVLTENYYVFMIEPYYPGLSSIDDENADCVVKGLTMDVKNIIVNNHIEENTCNLKTTITKKGTDLFEIYEC